MDHNEVIEIKTVTNFTEIDDQIIFKDAFYERRVEAIDKFRDYNDSNE